MVDGGDHPRACGWRARTSPPASRCSRVSRGRSPTAAGPRRRHRRGPVHRVLAHRTYPLAWAPRWQHESSENPVSPSPTSSAGSSGPRASTSGWSKASAVHVARRDDDDDVDLRAPAFARDLVVVVGEASLGTINAVRLSSPPSPTSPSSSRSIASPPNRCPSGSRAHLGFERDGLDVVDRTRASSGAPSPPTVVDEQAPARPRGASSRSRSSDQQYVPASAAPRTRRPTRARRRLAASPSPPSCTSPAPAQLTLPIVLAHDARPSSRSRRRPPADRRDLFSYHDRQPHRHALQRQSLHARAGRLPTRPHPAGDRPRVAARASLYGPRSRGVGGHRLG